MGKLPGIQTIRRTGGLGATNTTDRGTAALCMGGIAVSGGAQLNTVYKLNNMQDAAALGINAAYDVTNVTLVYYHISEFFRLAPSGTLLIMLISQSATLTNMCDSTYAHGLKVLLSDPLCAGKVRYAGAALNPASGYTPTIANGINSDTIALASSVYSGAVIKAQALTEIMWGLKAPVQIFVEGRDFTGSDSALLDATASLSNAVQIVMAADNDVSNANALYNGHAAVGTFLGLRAGLQVQQKMSYVAVGNIQDESIPVWVNPGFSGNAGANLLSNFTAGYWLNGSYVSGQQDNIMSKGFMGVRTITNTPGVFVSNDISATVLTDQYYVGPNSLVVNEAARIVYATDAQHIDEDVDIDSTTGYLDPVVVADWDSNLDNALTTQLGTNVSSASALIDPNQNLLATATINVQIVIVPKGYATQINEYIGLNNPFNG